MKYNKIYLNSVSSVGYAIDIAKENGFVLYNDIHEEHEQIRKIYPCLCNRTFIKDNKFYYFVEWTDDWKQIILEDITEVFNQVRSVK